MPSDFLTRLAFGMMLWPALLVCGCGSGVAAVEADTAPVSLAVPHPSASVTNFGDSITCGQGAQPLDGVGNVHSSNGYAGLLDKALNLPANNLCRDGDQAADAARYWIYPNAAPTADGNQLYTVMLGTNDANFCGVSAACVSNWSSAYAAALVWLALPSIDKHAATEMVATGSWKPDTILVQGMTTSAAGDRLSYDVDQVTAGRMLNVAYRVVDRSVVAGGSASVALDGVPVATLLTNPTLPIATANGTTDTVYLARIPMGAAGVHRVTLTTTSAGQFSVLWVGVASQSYDQVAAAPHVLVNLMLGSPMSSFADRLTVYSTQIRALVKALRADGLYVTVADPGNALNGTTDFADFLHPNSAGHAKLAAIDEAALMRP